VVTPYYGYYALSAMARTGHRAEALAWMRHYGGGMLAEEATSFWEAYDPRWPKEDFHRHLEADNKKGYYVSLAHGWSSGPTAWLMEEILGIHPTGAGFREVTIRPDLAGLAWAEGGEPTPRGLITIKIHPGATVVTVPAGTVARVLLPIDRAGRTILSNGSVIPCSLAEGGTRVVVVLPHAGRYDLQQR
jgi:alpha-L-rhamnosidase